MADVLVVADDLTGANASAAGFAMAGWRAVTVSRTVDWGAVAEFHSRFDIVIVTTDTRHADPVEAAEVASQIVRAGWPVQLVSSRIDTTLRGNVGSATWALLRTVRELSTQRVVGLCMPAHPAAGRQTVDGYQLLEGVRLEDTELAHDVRSPIRSSLVHDALQTGASPTTALLPLSVVTGREEALLSALRAAVDGGTDVVIADALTTDHLARVARAAAALGADDAGLGWVGIDPGPGSLALAQALMPQHSRSGAPLLAVSGSATDLTRAQLARLIAEREVVLVSPVGGCRPDIDATAQRLTDALAATAPGTVVLLTTVLEAADIQTLTPAESIALPTALGRVARRALEGSPIDGLYTTGGDVTSAVLAALGGQGIAVEEEVLPLATAGEIVGGPWDGLPIATKGGLVGGTSAAVDCIDHLARSAVLRSRWVRAALPRERRSV